MGNAIKAGDTVMCRLYNTPERRFYGPAFEAVVLYVGQPRLDLYTADANYTVQYPDGRTINLHRNEILRRVKRE